MDFSLDLSLSRTTIVRESLLGRASSGYFTDPLVLNFDGGPDLLSDLFFTFDLNGDGTAETLPGLPKGSGFLALDSDGDGMITSGLELFGPASGSGFTDLALHDSDQNNWIDENDPVFDRLRIWFNPTGASQQLVTLKEAGVGALSLANAGTLFNLKGPANTLLGQVTASGIFLMESGEVKSLQDLNLAAAKDNEPADNQAASANPALEASFERLREIIARQRRHLAALANRYRVHWQREQSVEDDRWHFLKRFSTLDEKDQTG